MTLAARLVAVLLAVLAALPAALSARADASAPRIAAGTGTTGMADQVLRRGCQPYAYTYALSPTTGDWLFETFLLDPDRQRVASETLTSDSDANPGASSVTLCRNVTRFGLFKLRGKLTTYDGYDIATTWITPTYVRLHRWGR